MQKTIEGITQRPYRKLFTALAAQFRPKPDKNHAQKRKSQGRRLHLEHRSSPANSSVLQTFPSSGTAVCSVYPLLPNLTLKIPRLTSSPPTYEPLYAYHPPPPPTQPDPKMVSHSSTPSRISFHVTFHIDPSNVPAFFAALKPAYDAVTAEPECVFFEVYRSAETPGKIKFVENWDATLDWLKDVSFPLSLTSFVAYVSSFLENRCHVDEGRETLTHYRYNSKRSTTRNIWTSRCRC